MRPVFRGWPKRVWGCPQASTRAPNWKLAVTARECPIRGDPIRVHPGRLADWAWRFLIDRRTGTGMSLLTTTLQLPRSSCVQIGVKAVLTGRSGTASPGLWNQRNGARLERGAEVVSLHQEQSRSPE